MFEEKRKSRRKPTSLYTNLLAVQNNNVIGECLLTDVCDSGFALESENKLSIGQKILLKFQLLNKSIFLAGEVVRKADGFFYPLYGAKISESDSLNISIFRQYIDNYLS